jgi:hypothetical protein
MLFRGTIPAVHRAVAGLSNQALPRVFTPTLFAWRVSTSAVADRADHRHDGKHYHRAPDRSTNPRVNIRQFRDAEQAAKDVQMLISEGQATVPALKSCLVDMWIDIRPHG